MQIFITVSINKVSQIYQIELGFEDVHGYIYIELIKTLICMCVNFLSSFSYVTTQVSVYFVAKNNSLGI